MNCSNTLFQHFIVKLFSVNSVFLFCKTANYQLQKIEKYQMSCIFPMQIEKNIEFYTLLNGWKLKTHPPAVLDTPLVNLIWFIGIFLKSGFICQYYSQVVWTKIGPIHFLVRCLRAPLSKACVLLFKIKNGCDEGWNIKFRLNSEELQQNSY